MKRKTLMWIVIAVVGFSLASLLSLYAYGRFAEDARGPPGQALPVAGPATAIDRLVEPLTAAHPGQAGLVVLADNLDAFAIRAASARVAGRSLDVQYYIWRQDLTGLLLDHELLRAADRGVRVRVLLDDLNAHGRNSLLTALDSHPLIEVRMFNPTRARAGTLARGVELLLRFFSVNRRMHNKAWIVDGQLAVVGGRNVGDEYFDAAADMNFMDTDVAVVGPPLRQAEAIFDAYWNSAAAIPLQELVQAKADALARLRARIDASLPAARAAPYVRRLQDVQVLDQLLRDGPRLHWCADAAIISDPPNKAQGAPPGPDWMTPVLLERASRSQQRLQVISPYFVPGSDGLRWFQDLRGRGVEVDILTNSLAATDVLAVHGGYAGYRVPLLRAGVALFELKPHGVRDSRRLIGSSSASLHTKAFVVDGAHGFIGSFNLDPRSMNLNTEMGLVFDCPGAVAELQALFDSKAAARTSYRLVLEAGELRWHDDALQPPRTWTNEPESGWWSRSVARVAGWLPIESQL